MSSRDNTEASRGRSHGIADVPGHVSYLLSQAREAAGVLAARLAELCLDVEVRVLDAAHPAGGEDNPKLSVVISAQDLRMLLDRAAGTEGVSHLQRLLDSVNEPEA